MFEYFAELDNNLYNRFKTLEKNMRSASNSFYDSYREVVEEFCKVVCRNSGLNADGNTRLNNLINSDAFCTVLLCCGTDDEDIKKIKNYVLKINKHVHSKEKEINFEQTVNYLKTLHSFTEKYCLSKGIVVKPVDLNEIQALYSEYEKEFEIKQRFDKRFSEYEEFSRQKQSDYRDTEWERIEAQRRWREEVEYKKKVEEANRYFFDHAHQTLCYSYSNKKFRIFKLSLLILLSVYVLLSFIIVITAAKVEYFWVWLHNPLQILYLIFLLRFITIKPEMEPFKLEGKMTYKLEYGKYLSVGDFKTRYTVCNVLSLLSLLCSIYDYLSLGNGGTVMRVNAVLQILAFGVSVAIYTISRVFFTDYMVTHLTGFDPLNKKFRECYLLSGQTMSKEQFENFISD